MSTELSRKEIESRINEILIDKLDVDSSECKPDTKLVEDLGADSLDVYELIIDLETEFDISIPDASINLMANGNVGFIYDLVSEQLNKQWYEV